MSNYSIYEVSVNELDQCADVIRRGFGTVAEEFGLTTDNCASNGAFIKTERLLGDKEKGNQMYALFVDDMIAGFMQLEKKSDEEFILEKLAVLPEYRHRGFGTKLFEYALHTVREMHGQKILIAIIEENTILKDWYLANGCMHVGTMKYDRLPFTVGFMEIDIEQEQN
jgi:ribosomal protein S18 acetylase RimI-like enzyme